MEIKKTEVVKSKPEAAKPGITVLAVFFARVKAFAGKGSVTALVAGSAGECRLYGASNCVKAGLLPEKYFGASLDPETLAALLMNKPVVIRGAEACRAFLGEHLVRGVTAADVLEDAFSRKGRGSGAGGDLRKF